MTKLFEIVRYFAHTRLRAAIRFRRWKKHKVPFLHEGLRGLRFELYPGEFIDSWIFVDGIYERRFLKLVSSKLARRGVFLDVGANIGNHALFLRDNFDEVHCFEPNPEAARRLRRNIELNRADNLSVHEIGLGERSGNFPFTPSGEGHLGEGTFARTDDTREIMLPMGRGDDFLRQLGIDRVDFIKIDVEGLEREVCRGFEETIRRSRPLIAFEYHGESEPIEMFDEIASALPGYIFVDAIPPAPSGRLAKIAYALRQGMEPPLEVITSPARRYYSAIIAFPSAESLEEFRIA